MPSIAPSTSTTARVARLPYLNSAPFYRGLTLGERRAFTDCAPRELGRRAAAGELLAGLMSLADYFRLQKVFERIGPFGIAVRGRGRTVLLFSRVPIRQLEGARIAVTEETSTSVVLLRLLLERRFGITPAAYEQERSADAEALLLIGDEALRFQQANTRYPYETDLAFEWWLWQHLPFVFAVWAIRKDAGASDKKELERALTKSLGMNMNQLDVIAQERSSHLGIPAADLQAYLAGFIYRLSQPEEAAITQFKALLDECRLL